MPSMRRQFRRHIHSHSLERKVTCGPVRPQTDMGKLGSTRHGHSHVSALVQSPFVVIRAQRRLRERSYPTIEKKWFIDAVLYAHNRR